ncbi:MAG TPA: DUF1553 domain-containing protein, partial [Pirellulales bacterium]|nr:DUF1553 domain-containing protein [Pirellulales bacterium]
ADGGTPGSLFPSVQDVPIHVRGSYAKLGPVVPRGLPKFFAGADQPAIREGSGRLELARWIASPDNPLTARVMANRIWQGHFGEGLVRTPSNFGKLGERPTHPALLDWLAAEFIRSGWSVKSMHRLLMSSAAYRRASAVATDAEAPRRLLKQDPDNRLFARWAPRRLEAECIRDALLSTAGALDLQLGGPAGEDLNVRRRSLYVQTTRWSRAYFSSLFDAADPDQPVGKRNVTTVAPQALFFLNHPFVREQAERLAGRLVAEAADDSVRLSQAYELLFSRPPGAEEAAVASDFLRGRAASDAVAAWTDFVQLLMASNEFSYVD